MKRIFIVTLSVLLLCIGILNNAAAQQRPMIIAFYDDFAPFSFMDNGKVTGVGYELLTEVLSNRMKVKLEFIAGPWVRMQEYVKTGKADAFCTIPTESRKEYTVPSKIPVIFSGMKIYVNKNNIRLDDIKAVKNLDDLRKAARTKKFIIGTYIGDGWAKLNLEAFHVEMYKARTLETIIVMLAYNRVDMVVSEYVIQRYTMKKLKNKLIAEGKEDAVEKLSEILELETVLDTGRLHLCINKNSPYLKIMKDFEREMDRAAKDGTRDKILKKYQ